MSLHEIILCATLPSQGLGAVTVHDIQTGAPLASFKHTSSASRCAAFVPSRAGLGGVMITAQADKAILNIYSFQKDQLLLKCVLPERLTCVAVDRDGILCAGGTAQGRIYLWELASGTLCNAWDAHYRQVTVLKFSQDGDALISGSEDAGVSIWSISRLLDEETQGTPSPLANLSDHTLPVTDIAVGIGSFPSCRLVSASMDCSVKLWDLSTNTLLTTFLLPRPLAHVALDATERFILAASAESAADIYHVNLYRKREDRVEAVGGAGVSDIVRIGGESKGDRDASSRKISTNEEITSLALSLTSTLLLTGTASGSVHIYDVRSHQHLRSINVGSKVTEVQAMLRPLDLFGHTSLVAREKDGISVRPIAPLQRTRASAGRDKDVNIVLSPTNKETTDAYSDYSADELQRDSSLFLRPTIADDGAQAALATSERVAELEEEVARLRAQLGHAKGINDAMWGAMVEKLVAQGKDGDGESEARAKKRGRKE